MATHLPVVGSSAVNTAFCTSRVDLGHGRHLTLDGNGKITASNGTYTDPRPNALSLRHVDDCPSSTPTCRASCYVHGLKAAVPDQWDMYVQNSRTLRELMAESTWVRRAAAERLGTWIHRNTTEFRWHVSGDVFDLAYAHWIADVARASVHVTQWIYTRSLWAVGVLSGAPNLVTNVSADVNNYRDALATARACGVRLCYMTGGGPLPEGLRPGDVIFPDYAIRPKSHNPPTEHPWWQALTQEQRRMVCPVDAFGAGEHVRCGPCRKCMKHA